MIGKHYALGVDIGGTSIKFGLVIRDEGLVKESRLLTEVEKGPDQIINKIVDEASVYVNQVNEMKGEPILIGIGVPGVVALDGGTVSYPPNLPGWEVIRLGDEVKARLERKAGMKVNVFVENDANLAALAECFYGAGKKFHDFVMITLGTGVGGGIILNNKIFRGSTGGAAEIGHMTIDKDSSVIHAGIRGSIESFIGWRKIVAYAEDILKKEGESSLRNVLEKQQLTAHDLYTAACDGDKVALSVWKYVGEVLGVGIGTIISILDIRKFIIGGGVSGAFEFFEPYARESFKHYSLEAMQSEVEIVRAQLENKAGVIGAAALCFH